MAAATGTGIDTVAWCRQVAELGAREILLTSMDRDGTSTGFDSFFRCYRPYARRCGCR